MQLFGTDKSKCQRCGADLPEGANFCPACGEPSARGKITCPQCQALVPADAVFCSRCRHQLKATAAPSVGGQRWAKGPDDFAARVDVQDIPGYFRKELIVEPGTRAIILLDGRNEGGELGPERYTLDSLFARVGGLRQARTATAILVDAGDVALDFAVPDLFTSDPLRITLDCRLTARVGNAVLFLVNVMKGRRTFSLGQLREHLRPEIQNAAAEAVSRRSVADLSSNLALKEDLATHIEAHLMETFKSMGLRFDRVSTVNFRHEPWDELNKRREEYFLQGSQEEADLVGRKRLADILDQKETQEIAEEAQKLARYERRADLWARMRQAVSANRMDEVRTEEDFARFMREIDRERIIGENELEELKREYRERQEDHDQARAHFLAKSRLEHDHELRMLAFARQRDLTLEQLALEEETRRRQVQLQIQEEEAKLALKIKRDRAERESERTDVEDGLDWLRKIKALKREDAQATQEIQLQAEERRQRLDLARLQAMSQLSTETLIATSGPEQARVLAELRRTETLRGMSEQQILALAAEKSPEVARAFLEKFRGLASEDLKAVFERLVETEKGAREDQTRVMRETMQTMERMFGKAVDAQAQAVSGAGRGVPPLASTSGLFSAGAPQVAASSRVAICRNCGRESAVGTRFCQNCGEEFYEVRKP